MLSREGCRGTAPILVIGQRACCRHAERMPMIALTNKQATIVDRYRTCEFATVTRSGVPIAWPTTSVHRPDGTLAISTSIGLAQKALNIRRNPDVALLFSNSTASGLQEATQVLVQGSADCPDEIE